MTVASTSIDAYIDHRASGRMGAQAARVFHLIASSPQPDISRAEIAAQLGERLSSVCGRVNELLDLKVIEQAGQRKCLMTGRTIRPVRLAEAP